MLPSIYRPVLVQEYIAECIEQSTKTGTISPRLEYQNTILVGSSVLRRSSDDRPCRNDCVLDNCDDATLDEVAISLPSSLLHLVCIDDLRDNGGRNMNEV